MTRMIMSTTFGVLACALTTTAFADLSPEKQIHYRQSGYSFMSWNMSRIKANLEGEFDQEQVVNAANVIAAIANSGMGALFSPGTDKDIGSAKTNVKPQFFQSKEEVEQLASDFIVAADNLAEVAADGEKADVVAAFGEVGQACKSCHEKFRADE